MTRACSTFRSLEALLPPFNAVVTLIRRLLRQSLRAGGGLKLRFLWCALFAGRRVLMQCWRTTRMVRSPTCYEFDQPEAGANDNPELFRNN